MNKNFKAYFNLLRPFTLLAPIIVSISVMIASYVYNNGTSESILTLLPIIIPASLTFALLNGASNALNQATDVKEDSISKKYRPIPSGAISSQKASQTAFILYLLAMILSLTINITFSFIILLISFFTITYSLPPKMKRILFLNQLWVAIPRGMLGIMASWSVFGNPLQNVPLAIGFIATLFLYGGTATKDLTDIIADKKTGIKTLVNTLGVTKAAYFSLIFMSLSFILIIPLVKLKILEINFLPLSLLVILSVLTFWKMIHVQSHKKHENSTAWTLMYTTYFIYALGFAFLTITAA